MSRHAEAMTMGYVVSGYLPARGVMRLDCPKGCGRAWRLQPGEEIPEAVRETLQAHLDSHKPVTPHDGGA